MVIKEPEKTKNPSNSESHYYPYQYITPQLTQDGAESGGECIPVVLQLCHSLEQIPNGWLLIAILIKSFEHFMLFETLFVGG